MDPTPSSTASKRQSTVHKCTIVPPDMQCPVELTIAILDGKWKPLILFYLLEKTRRFGELERLLSQVTRRMLTQHLRELELDGIVHREVFQQVPPKVEYSLTPLGVTLKPILLMMLQWGEQYLAQLEAGAAGNVPPTMPHE